MQPRIIDEPMPVEEQGNGLKTYSRSFKVAVKTKAEPSDWSYNGLRFGFRAHAEKYAKELQLRWAAVVEYLIVISADTPNCVYPVPSDRYPVSRLDSKG